MHKKVNGLELEFVVGDITTQEDIDAVVNAANAFLAPGGGVAGAIHRVAGPRLEEECRSLAPISTGQCVITDAYNLPNRRVIHCLGPVYGKDEPAAELLSLCYRNALELADENQMRSIAFPAISTGIFGYPLSEAAQVSLKAVIETIPRLRHLNRIRFVLYDQPARESHEQALLRILSRGR